MIFVYKGYEVEIKMVQQQGLQLKADFCFLNHKMKIVIY